MPAPPCLWSGLLQEDVAAELTSAKVKLQPPVAPASSSGGGCDCGFIDGPPGARPLLIVKAARHKPGATPQALNAFVYFGLEAASHYCWAPGNPDKKLSAIFDFSGTAAAAAGLS